MHFYCSCPSPFKECRHIRILCSTLTSGSCSVFYSACLSLLSPRKRRPMLRPLHLASPSSPQPHTHPGISNLRLAVVTPFVDRQHGTERAMAELLDRLRREHGCEIHLYAERIADLSV